MMEWAECTMISCDLMHSDSLGAWYGATKESIGFG